MRVVGVDPGHYGALCLLNTELLTVMNIFIKDMPVVDGRVNPHALAEIFEHWGHKKAIDLVAVEAVHSMPRQGVASSFKFGMGYGMILGIVASLQLPLVNVQPTKWTKDLAVGPDKERHRRLAIETWPGRSTFFARKKDEGRADAALIAKWAAQQATMTRSA